MDRTAAVSCEEAEEKVSIRRNWMEGQADEWRAIQKLPPMQGSSIICRGLEVGFDEDNVISLSQTSSQKLPFSQDPQFPADGQMELMEAP